MSTRTIGLIFSTFWALNCLLAAAGALAALYVAIVSARSRYRLAAWLLLVACSATALLDLVQLLASTLASALYSSLGANGWAWSQTFLSLLELLAVAATGACYLGFRRGSAPNRGLDGAA